MVVVEGRHPRCWWCKQIGHIAKFCPQKTESTEITAATAATISKQAKVQDPGQVQPKTSNQEGWTEVTWKRKGSPKQGETSTTSPPQKQTTSEKTQKSTSATTATTLEPKPRTPASPAVPAPPATPGSPAALCSVELESVGDFQLRKPLKPLLSLEKIKLNVSHPANFRSAAMVTTFVRSAGNRTRGVWNFLSTVSQTYTGMKLVELEHSSLKKCIPYCSGRVPILVHPSLYRSLKLRFPLDVGGITRDNQVTSELGTGSLRQAVGILTSKDFQPIVANE